MLNTAATTSKAARPTVRPTLQLTRRPPAKQPPKLPVSGYRIAKLTGLSDTHVRRVLKGETRANLESAYKIATAAGVTLDELVRRMYGVDDRVTKEVAKVESRRKAWLEAESANKLKAEMKFHTNAEHDRRK
jgi:transcriptional regulator with XRE-family HTH domain